MAAATAAIPSREIPTTFGASLKSWWTTNDKTSALAESRLFQRLFHPDADTPISASSDLVHLDKHRFINTLSVLPTTPKPDAPEPVVMLPGYGAGIGFYMHNLPAVAKWSGHRGTSLYAVDWLGMGRSARVPFRITAPRKDISGRVTEAESFFIDALEEWRVKMQLEKMTLVGHSLGGYLSVAYALKYPDRVNKLILLSPAGVPRDPNETTAPERELETPPHGSSLSVDAATDKRVQEIKAEQVRKAPESRRIKLVRYLWEEGFSPFQVVRNTLFWAPMLVGKYSSRRFSGLTEEETRDMHDYILHLTLAKGSGEYSISHLLAPGAHARRPLVDRVAALKIPVTFVYGDHDWMDPEGGALAVENLRKAGNGNARSYIVNDAGHHVYLDNATAVNNLLVKELNRK